MLKVMTLNLNYYADKHGSWNDRKKLIAEAISQADPDIITLQAVAKDPGQEGGQDQAAQLAALLPAYRHHYFQAAVTQRGGV